MSEAFRYQEQVEAELGRPLTADELIVVPNSDQLSGVQKEVVKVLADRQRVALIAYLEAIIPDALRFEIMQFVNGL